MLPINNIQDLTQLAELLAKSGFFEDAKQPAQAAVKLLTGIELGFPTMASLTGIHIIHGKPTMGANLIAASLKRSSKYDYRILELTGELCRIEFFEIVGEKWLSLGISGFTIEDACKASCQHLDKFPRNMLFARAISNGVRWYCPDIFLGVTIYTPEELEGIEEQEQEPEQEMPAVEVEEASALPATPEPARALPEATSPKVSFPQPIYKTWKKPEQAIAWAVEQGIGDDEAHSLMNGIEAQNGKKAHLFHEKVCQLLEVMREQNDIDVTVDAAPVEMSLDKIPY